MDGKLTIVVNGATGNMGKQTLITLAENPESIKVVGAVSQSISASFLEDNNLDREILVSQTLPDLLKTTAPDLLIDFSIRESAMESAAICAANDIDFITGTSGLTESDVSELELLANKNNIGIFVAPNFSLGAVILQHISALAGRHFDNAEIIEMHHSGKIDAPSGSSIATAKDMTHSDHGSEFTSSKTEKFNVEGSRGAIINGVGIHSVRLPGLMARQEVILGGKGEVLNLSHTTLNRESYMPGLMLAIDYVSNNKIFTFGLGSILNL